MESRQRRSKTDKVRIDTLRVPPAGKAQRPFHPSKGDAIAADFDIDSFGFPVVCRVDGVNWLVDGQHRVYAIQKCGHATSIDEIECEVYEGLTMAEMARMFLGRNRSTPVTAFERFGVAVTAGYPAESAIAEIVAGTGLKIGYPKTDGNVYSVGALRRVYDRDGAGVLDRVLRVLRDAYNSSAHAFGARLVDGDDGTSAVGAEQERLIIFAAAVAADVAAVRRVADALHDAWAEGGLGRNTTEVAEVAASACWVIGLALATVEHTLDCVCTGRLPPS